jgi:hypothetical protein
MQFPGTLRRLARLAKDPLPGAVMLATLLVAALLVTGDLGAGAPPASASRDTRILLAGDSVAETLGWGLSVEAPRYGVRFRDVALIGCGVTRATPIDYGGVPFPTEPYCQTWPQTYAKAVASFRPQVAALLVGRWEVANAYWDGHWTDIDNPGYSAYIASELALAIRILSSKGAKVALLTAPFYAYKTEPFEPLGAKSCSPGCNRHFPEDDPGRIVRFNRILREVASSFPGVATVIPLGAHVDPQGHFQETIDGVQVRDADGIHFSVPAGGEWVAPWLYPRLLSLAAPSS